jgi:putative transposase
VVTGVVSVKVELARTSLTTETPMTDDSMRLLEIVQKSDDGDFLKTIAETALQRIMDADVENIIGAARHERSPERLTYRNGYRERTLETRLGALELKVPKLRAGPAYFPSFLEPRRTIEKALTAVVQEAWISGVSTRRVEDLVQAMGATGISKSQVSKLCKEIDERVHSFLERPLDGDWPYVWLDATYLKQRQGGRIISVAVIIAVAANTEGRREIIGLNVGLSEAAPFWIDFLRSLTRRGLKGVKLVISDAHEGLKKAIGQVLGATWQRCRVHTMRNLLVRVPKAQQSRVAATIREVFVQPSHDKARDLWRTITVSAHNRLPKLAQAMEEAEDDVLAYMSFPKAHRTKLHSTNTLERLNREVKRRADVVGIFPNEASIVRLIGAVLMEANDEWSLQNRYLSLEPLSNLPPSGEDETDLLAPPDEAQHPTPAAA